MNRRDLLIGGIGLSCSGLAWAGARETAIAPLPEEALEHLIPKRFGPWEAVSAGGVVLPPESEMSDQAYNDVLARVYHNGAGDSVTLLLAYGSFQGRDMQLHRPELCYPAAGFAIKSSREVDLSLPNAPPISAKLMDTASQMRPEQVLYWTRVGQAFPTTQLAQRWSVLSQNFRGNVPDGMLVRTSTTTQGPETALPILQSFAASLLQHAGARTRKLLVGQA